MSKPVKNLIIKAYEELFASIDGAVMVSIRGLESNDNNELRASLRENEMRVTIVKSSLAKRAVSGTSLEPVSEMFDGPCAVVYGGESVVNVARELIKHAKAHEQIEFRGAVMEGVVFGPNDIDALSKFPTRDEALSQAVQVILGPAASLVAAISGPGSAVAGILATVEEKLEKGEAIEKVA